MGIRSVVTYVFLASPIPVEKIKETLKCSECFLFPVRILCKRFSK